MIMYLTIACEIKDTWKQTGSEGLGHDNNVSISHYTTDHAKQRSNMLIWRYGVTKPAIVREFFIWQAKKFYTGVKEQVNPSKLRWICLLLSNQGSKRVMHLTHIIFSITNAQPESTIAFYWLGSWQFLWKRLWCYFLQYLKRNIIVSKISNSSHMH
jgi:hypothetical protein